MTSLHRKWSPKVTVADGKKTEGGVAACLNWNYGVRSTKPPNPDEVRQAEMSRLQEAVDRVLLDLREQNAAAPEAPTPPATPAATPTPPRTASSRAERDGQTSPPGGDFRKTTSRPATPGFVGHRNEEDSKVQRNNKWCTHVSPADRVRPAAGPQLVGQLRTVEAATNTGTGSEFKFLKKYFNRPLTDDQLRAILQETHRRISDKLVEDAITRTTRPMTDHVTTIKPANGRLNGAPLAVTRHHVTVNGAGRNAPNELMVTGRKEPRRPSSAHGSLPVESRENRQLSRPASASPEMKSSRRPGNRHFSSWRPNTMVAPTCGWTRNSNDYSDLWRLAAKYRTKRHDGPKPLGSVRYNNQNNYNNNHEYQDNHATTLPQQHQLTQGKVSLQLNCCPDSEMTINIRVQKSRDGYRY